MLIGERRMTPHQIVRPRTLGEPFENEFDGDPRAAKDGLAEHNPGYPLDALLPVHNGIVAIATPFEQSEQRYGNTPIEPGSGLSLSPSHE
jgi:hypothetical protein